MENKEKLGRHPAFPLDGEILLQIAREMHLSPLGMNKRFYAACSAMQGMLTNSKTGDEMTFKKIISTSYMLADELLKQENE